MNQKPETPITSLSAREVAQRLGVTRKTIAEWARDGITFPHAFKLNPNRTNSSWRIPLSDVIALEEQRTRQ